jgi:hypothetical protein
VLATPKVFTLTAARISADVAKNKPSNEYTVDWEMTFKNWETTDNV